MNTRQIVILTALFAILALTLTQFAGCGPAPQTAKEEAVQAEQETATAPPAEPNESPEPAAAPEPPKPTPEAAPAVGRKALMNPSSLKEQAPENFKVKMETSKGDIIVDVTRAWAPRGVDRFYNLVKNGYYDECRFFRVVDNFVVQFGMNGDPAVYAMWREARIPDDPVIRSNGRGRLTFAKTYEPNSRTTQVFINLKDNRSLDDQGFAPFGEIVEGMEVIEQLYSGYGELPDQSMITNQGNQYLTGKFPKLDYIKKATIM